MYFSSLSGELYDVLLYFTDVLFVFMVGLFVHYPLFNEILNFHRLSKRITVSIQQAAQFLKGSSIVHIQ